MSDEAAWVGAKGVPTRGQQRDPGEAAAALEAWFRRAGMPPDLEVTEVRLPQASGVANETLFCDAAWTDAGSWHAATFVVRVSSPDFLYKDVDFSAHHRLYEALADVPGVPVPRVVGSETDPSILGEAFFVMAHVEGRVPEDTPPFHTAGWVTDVPADDRERMWRDAVAVMARLHRVDPERVSFLDRPGAGPTGLDQNLRYWFDYGNWAAAGREHPVVAAGAAWLGVNRPDRPATGFAWGDARVGNMIFDGTAVAAVLDWDMVSLAGAESDLAWWTIMDYLHTESAGVERLAGIGSPAETIRLWEQESGREAQDLWFHLVFGAYRMSVILMRLSDLLLAAGLLPAEHAAEMATSNPGVQYLATMLDVEPVGPVTTPWPGLEV